MAANCIQANLVGTIFTGVRLNADPESEAGVAGLDDNGTLQKIRSIDTDLCPVNITGDKTDERTDLDDVGDTQHDHCLQVVFAPTTILIICALSITLYDCTFTRIATYSFGWSQTHLSCTPFPPFPQLLFPKYPLDVDLFDAPTSSSASEPSDLKGQTRLGFGSLGSALKGSGSAASHHHMDTPARPRYGLTLGGARRLRDAHRSCLPRSAQP
ncbi:hypothetical protein ARMGADRAFT_1086891 [Armillaria gallica]|uniref:Uncharacterized protein n=1 Tax=Armillaria gallica TaxID=47427 RepID=A0A2H3D5S1_ARMGA|nr:hypothetical protein ARMGADRAFT_1086891 [Armillaria gallica]